MVLGSIQFQLMPWDFLKVNAYVKSDQKCHGNNHLATLLLQGLVQIPDTHCTIEEKGGKGVMCCRALRSVRIVSL